MFIGKGAARAPRRLAAMAAGAGLGLAALLAPQAADAAITYTFSETGAFFGDATFTFTADTYDSGEGPMQVLKSEKNGDAYTLTFADDYQIGLANITATEMDWASGASGDTFHCKRIEN